MLSKFSPGHRFILAALGLVAIAVTLAYLVSGLLALLISVVLCAVIWLLKGTVMPSHHGNTKVRLLSLICFFGLIGSFGFWSEFVNSTIAAAASEPAIREWIPWLGKISLGNEPSYAVIGAGLLALIAVNYFLPDRSIPGKHPTPIEQEFPEPRFEQKLNAFCSALEQYLVNTDRQANWSPEFYTELEAEVEIQNAIGSSQRKRVANLQRAIRSDRDTQAFLILGDPGSGKSVALRKLARDMLKQVSATGRVPIYINLREWAHPHAQAGGVWTEQAPPTLRDLERFVIERLKNIGDVFTEEFVGQYFHKLWQHGRLFFLFDSFDEIPELLDSSEESWLIESLSTIFSRFIASSPQSRGILASRIFRRPTSAYLAGKVLEIRPLAEEGIINALSRHPEFTEAIKARLFRDRQDLVPVARNPLLASLLGEWVQTHRDLPANQADLYHDYLLNRLKQCSARIEAKGLSVQQVLDIAQDIAWFVFESPAYGLEAPVQVLADQTISTHTDSVIDILSYARVARVTTIEPKSFAFSHRRFLEYFVTIKLLSMPDRLPTEHIPADSRGRDALTLYAQVCDDESASRLAALCWKEINENFDSPTKKLRAIHSLRFLIDGFRSRREAIISFSSDLTEFIMDRISSSKNLVHAKICLEGTGLLSNNQAGPILDLAINSKNIWLQETAFRACRQLPRLEKKLEQSIYAYIVEISSLRLWNNRKSLIFSLSLSDALRKLKNTVRIRTINLQISAAFLLAMFAIAPFLISFSILVGISKALVDDRPKIERKKTERSDRKPSAQMHQLTQAEKIVFGTRFSSVLILLIFSYSILLGEENKAALGVFAPYIRESVKEPMTLGFICLISAFFISDIIGIKEFFRKIFVRIKIPRNILGWVVTLILCVLVNALVDFFVQKSQTIKIWFGPILFFIITLPIFLSIIRSIIVEAKDRKYFRKITIKSIMHRSEIAKSLGVLKSNRCRLAYVKNLIEKHTIATGNWPEHFNLSISSDPAITELAKLEERWLGLDR